MEKSTVYFTDFRCPVGTSQLDKLKKLCVTAGIKNIDMDGKFVAIKMHFGELGNLAFLRPNYAKAVADLCKEQGGLPFLTDCNTLYPGSRKNALEHLECANLNGFNSISTGCQIIIGDGLRGTDEVEVPVVNGEYCQTALIGHAIMDADIFISSINSSIFPTVLASYLLFSGRISAIINLSRVDICGFVLICHIAPVVRTSGAFYIFIIQHICHHFLLIWI